MKKPKAAKGKKVKYETMPLMTHGPITKIIMGAAELARKEKEDAAMREDFLADVPQAKANDLRPAMKRDALEEGYHALEDSRIDHAKAIRELSGDMGRLAHLIALYLPSERRGDFKCEAADILNRKQEQS